jgi:BASS family bile acid:Na+ symporter
VIPLKDLLLVCVNFLSILLGIVAPRLGIFFQPYPTYCQMLILFFSFILIQQSDIFNTLKHSAGLVATLLFLKLILLPIGIFFLIRIVFPNYALAALLISGISAGIMSPFLSQLLKANSPLVIVIVVISSFLVPFTLPVLTKLLVGHGVEIPLLGMTRILGFMIFVPIISLEILRKITPGLINNLSRIKYPASLLLITINNLGLFSIYSDFLMNNPNIIIGSFLMTILLSTVYLIFGLLVAWKKPIENALSIVITFGLINNMLVAVFSSRFFGPIETTVAALYSVCFFGLLVPLRFYRNFRLRFEHSDHKTGFLENSD